jgi:hypothetical protein
MRRWSEAITLLRVDQAVEALGHDFHVAQQDALPL